ncbi:kinase-like domain-containing protein [Crucibulum laeve]|uniref:Kinase-like domain-containing protein n=1 Tax=Crucibulum laeve TaxID=68775 RepID=A0A5C3M3V3_9AGAR|nr:kinase-like domain-containing protein [Crucibulum laeve]
MGAGVWSYCLWLRPLQCSRPPSPFLYSAIKVGTLLLKHRFLSTFISMLSAFNRINLELGGNVQLLPPEEQESYGSSDQTEVLASYDSPITVHKRYRHVVSTTAEFDEKKLQEFSKPLETVPIHPNIAWTCIVPAKDALKVASECVNGKHFLILSRDSYNNSDIVSFIKQHPETDRLQLILPIAHAVETLHKNHIVHGNLYPGNILITDTQDAILTDVGVATIVAQLPGTVPVGPSTIYKSISELEGDTTSPTLEMETYSLAAIIYVIYGGVLPFQSMAPQRQIGKILKAGGIHCHFSKPDSMPDTLWFILQKCWIMDSSEPATVHELVQCLKGLCLVDNESSHPTLSSIV